MALSSWRRTSRTPSLAGFARREGPTAESADRLLRADPEEGDRADDGHVRRRLQPVEGRRHEEPHVLLGLRGWHSARFDDGADHRAHVPDPGRVVRREAARLRRRESRTRTTSGFFRQVEPIDFFPTYYPAMPPPTEPLPPSSGAAADPCGVLSSDEQSAMIGAAASAKPSTAKSPSLNEIASVALTADKADKATRPTRKQ